MIIGKSRTNQPVEGEEELKIFENIVDKDGHHRFIEGDITLKSTLEETIIPLYAKWSLSGSHLLIVFAFSLPSGKSYTGQKIADLEDVPQWIKDKMVITFGSISVLKSNVLIYDTVGNYVTSIPSTLTKDDNIISLYSENLSASADRIGRISFDLLIDND